MRAMNIFIASILLVCGLGATGCSKSTLTYSNNLFSFEYPQGYTVREYEGVVISSGLGLRISFNKTPDIAAWDSKSVSAEFNPYQNCNPSSTMLNGYDCWQIVEKIPGLIEEHHFVPVKQGYILISAFRFVNGRFRNERIKTAIDSFTILDQNLLASKNASVYGYELEEWQLIGSFKRDVSDPKGPIPAPRPGFVKYEGSFFSVDIPREARNISTGKDDLMLDSPDIDMTISIKPEKVEGELIETESEFWEKSKNNTTLTIQRIKIGQRPMLLQSSSYEGKLYEMLIVPVEHGVVKILYTGDINKDIGIPDDQDVARHIFNSFRITKPDFVKSLLKPEYGSKLIGNKIFEVKIPKGCSFAQYYNALTWDFFIKAYDSLDPIKIGTIRICPEKYTDGLFQIKNMIYGMNFYKSEKFKIGDMEYNCYDYYDIDSGRKTRTKTMLVVVPLMLLVDGQKALAHIYFSDFENAKAFRVMNEIVQSIEFRDGSK
jgi:hypothetical protein